MGPMLCLRDSLYVAVMRTPQNPELSKPGDVRKFPCNRVDTYFLWGTPLRCGQIIHQRKRPPATVKQGVRQFGATELTSVSHDSEPVNKLCGSPTLLWTYRIFHHLYLMFCRIGWRAYRLLIYAGNFFTPEIKRAGGC